MPLHSRSSSASSSISSSSTSSYASFSGTPKIDFHALLEGRTRSPISLDDFRDYLLSCEYGSESLDFYVSVEYLKSLSRPDKVQIVRRTPAQMPSLSTYGTKDTESVARAMVERFIVPGSAQEINLDSATREKILFAHHNGWCTADTFVGAQVQCYELMRTNSLPRFLERVGRNIGVDEIAVRRMAAALFDVITLVLVILALGLPTFPRGVRWVIIIPAMLAFMLTQATFAEFCPAYGLLRKVRLVGRGFYGFQKPGETLSIEEGCIRSAHAHRAILASGISLAFGVAFAAVIYAIPVNV